MNTRRLSRPVLTLATVASIVLVGTLIDIACQPDATARAPASAEAATERLVHQHFQQAVAMLHARHYEYAVQSLHEVLALRPKMPEAHANMGFALLGLGRTEAARDFFRSATDLRPSQYNAYYGLAITAEESGDLPAAIAAMQTYAHVAPAGDPYRRKAEAAVWEWQAELEGRKE